MGLLLSTRRALIGAPSPTYADKVLGYAPIAYWPLWETAGAAAECQVNTLQNGTAVGVTWNNAVGPDGVNGAPFFDGANDSVDVYSAMLDAAFDGNLGTFAIWGRVANVGVWTDAAFRALLKLGEDNNNYIDMFRSNVNNSLMWRRNAAGGTLSRTVAGYSTTAWFCMAYTWNQAGGVQQPYYNGVASAAPLGGGNVYAGALSANRCYIGVGDSVLNFPWHGWLAHAAIWDRVLTGPEILDLATV